MINTVQASDQWNYYQAEGIKQSILEGRVEVADAVGGASKSQAEKIKHYEEKRKELRAEAEKLGTEAIDHDRHHVIYSRAVTLFQVAIAISAVSVLSRLKSFWFVSMAIGTLGLVLFVYGFR